MKKILYMHVGSGNHGCEAIIRTTSKMLEGPEDVILWSGTKSEDVKYLSARGFEKIVSAEEIKKYSMSYFEALFRRKLLHDKTATNRIFLRDLFHGNIAISVGGDNYCYPWSAMQNVELNKEIRKHCKASVLWGCSIDKKAITPEVKEDLAGYSLITARESLTYRLLKDINPNTVKIADPAFLLEANYLPLPEGFIEGNTVGINVSPMIMDYGDRNCILRNYEKLIQFIIANTDMSVCLVPHVVWQYNDDRRPIEHLYKMFCSTNRICKIDDGNAEELKGYIARCRMFVGARTHATIAAYSSCVPTLVVGYSVKSIGIAIDLFGTDEGYVLPVQEMKEETDLVEKFKIFVEHEDEQRQILKEVIPEYKELAFSAKKHLQKLY